eukprot:CAMPEP_0117422292 /NCGR_PEP_ID=MMETSP0758-20121206/3165_1 /TAXON_ID=63605 /ORGANISM="Percolomonas cosmopolitus, Strain AE-1 (ATCC 50343)" /LENGTH=550 /DNA_ID=CAMNT_0005204833 /DNA_START=399 /DNA_END=2048 /DNA_ORIENTATION=-
MLSLRLRINLSTFIHDRYLNDTLFYKATNLGASRIDHADQRVTSDVTNFAEAIPDIYCAVFKPSLDIVLFSTLLSRTTGWQGPAILYGYLLFSFAIKRGLMPSFGKLIAVESELKGRYRTAHAKLITNAEEIAFYQGSQREKGIINNSLENLRNHSAYVTYLKALVSFADDIYMKYLVSIAGYAVLIAPQIFNFKNTRSKSTQELTREAIKSMRYLNVCKEAGLDLVLSGNRIQQLVGYTDRVCELLEKLNQLQEEGDKKFELSHAEVTHFPDTNKAEEAAFTNDWMKQCEVRSQEIKASLGTKDGDVLNQVIGGGKTVQGDILKFNDVSIVSPEGKILVNNLNFEVTPGQHVMVTGPNGCGKSSLFRVIGGLWPVHCGVMTRPGSHDVVFVPQKPYLVLGTLRDQLIYPHDKSTMEKRGVTDEDLTNLLRIVDPELEVLQDWTFDTEKNWFLAFSGGQKQRIAMARLFYHRPRYAILDECTSAVSDEVEDKIYETCSNLGITIFSVSHRKNLIIHHEYNLNFEPYPHCGYTYKKIDEAQKAPWRRKVKV